MHMVPLTADPKNPEFPCKSTIPVVLRLLMVAVPVTERSFAKHVTERRAARAVGKKTFIFIGWRVEFCP